MTGIEYEDLQRLLANPGEATGHRGDGSVGGIPVPTAADLEAKQDADPALDELSGATVEAWGKSWLAISEAAAARAALGLGSAATMSPVEVVTDEDAQAALSGAFAPLAAGMEGTGFPEGVVTAPVGTVYRDLAATNGAVVWVKATGTGNTGWRVVWGDTGARNVADLVSAPNLSVSTARLHRVGSVVTLTLHVVTSEGWSSGTQIMTVPSGFRTVGSLTRFMPAGYATSVNPARLTGAGALLLYSASTGSSYYEWTWLTTDAWPSALPGTAA